MADYTLTGANVLASATSLKGSGLAGEAILAGQNLYRKASDGRLYLADANDATKIPVVGIALAPAAAAQPVSYVYQDDDFIHGLTTVASGDVIVASATAGGSAPSADIASGWYPIVAQVAKSATKSIVRLVNGPAVK